MINGGITLQTTFIDKSAVTGKTYYYAVTAVGKDNKETAKSNIVSAARTIVQPAIMFSDVPSYHWAKDFINTLAGKNILSGYADGTFRPESTITRAEFAKVIANAKGWSLVDPATPSFNDVPRSHWAYRYIETARQHGVIGGYPDGTFKPGNNINRAEICKIIVMAGGYALTSTSATFTDLPRSHWAYRYILTARSQSIVGGYNDGTFRPAGYTTRAEAAKMVYKTLGLSA